MKPTDKQIQEFWELCGLKWDSVIGHWDYPDSSPHSQLPPIDLNNLWRYAMPKLMGHNYLIGYCVLLEWIKEYTNVWNTVDPALALFWTIYRALGGNQ